MRLICPNCGAQYEVADDVVPQGGRDVQCSNCGHTWFEQPGASVAAETWTQPPPNRTPDPEPHDVSEPDIEDEVAPEEEPEPEADYDIEGDVEAEGEASDAPDTETEAAAEEPEPQDDADDASDDEDAPQQAERQQRELDPGVADILREEAEFEQSARQAEADPIETQPDLGLDTTPEDEDRRTREARDRLARLRGEPEAATAAAAAVAATISEDNDAPRRELLPDIEEINSSLRPDDAGREELGEDEPAERRSGFRRGFMYMVILALLAVAVYVFAPQISAAVPAIEPALNSYVEWVNGLRLWLDMQIQGFIEQGGDGSADVPADREG